MIRKSTLYGFDKNVHCWVLFIHRIQIFLHLRYFSFYVRINFISFLKSGHKFLGSEISHIIRHQFLTTSILTMH